jgi:hypothetical protein
MTPLSEGKEHRILTVGVAQMVEGFGRHSLPTEPVAKFDDPGNNQNHYC